MAKTGGMEAVCASAHFSECIRKRPEGRNELLKIDVGEFVSGDGALARCVLAFREPARDRRHREPSYSHCGFRSALFPVTIEFTILLRHKKLLRSRRFVELHDGVVERRSGDNLKEHWDPDEWAAAEPAIADIFAGFVKRADAEALVAIGRGSDRSDAAPGG